MKRIQKVPTKQFVKELLNSPSITRIVEDWSLEYEVMANTITNFLHNMGIYEIDPISQKGAILDTIKSQLFNSPGIHRRLQELKRLQEENNSRKRKQGAS